MIDSIIYIPDISLLDDRGLLPEGVIKVKDIAALLYTRTKKPLTDDRITVLASGLYTGTGTAERVYQQLQDDPDALALYTSVYDTAPYEADDGEGGTVTVTPPFKFGMLAESALPVPSEITPRQARLVLAKHALLTSVSDAIAAIDDEQQRQAAEIEWEYATSIERRAEWVNTLYAALGLDQAGVDSLFIEAAML